MGDPGCLSLFGRQGSEHQLLAEHLTAEYRVRTEARGRIVDEWKLRPDGRDNHWFDCLVGCAVAASIQGAALASVESHKTIGGTDYERLADAPEASATADAQGPTAVTGLTLGVPG